MRYDWGSPTAIPALMGRTPDGRPVAEMWLGAHASAPSVVASATEELTLRELVAGDPAGTLGADSVAKHGAGLPYLMKLIAAGKPLSLQVHPTSEVARRGFEREEAARVDRGSGSRTFKDLHHKPEMVIALTEFDALAGLRPADDLRVLLGALDGRLASLMRKVVSRRGVDDVRTELLRTVLTDPSSGSEEGVAELVEQAAVLSRESGWIGDAFRTMVALGARFPGDRGAVASLALQRLVLSPWQAAYLPPGTPHAYLGGTALEIMANSDNVIRGGLTSKHVDVPLLLECIDWDAPSVVVWSGTQSGSQRRFDAPGGEFGVARVDVFGRSTSETSTGPRIALCLAGEVSVHALGGNAELRRGDSVFVRDDDGPLEMYGNGTLAVALVPGGSCG